jgi:hypothetical protein
MLLEYFARLTELYNITKKIVNYNHTRRYFYFLNEISDFCFSCSYYGKISSIPFFTIELKSFRGECRYCWNRWIHTKMSFEQCPCVYSPEGPRKGRKSGGHLTQDIFQGTF